MSLESAVKITVVYHTNHIETKKRAADERMHTADHRIIRRVQTARLFLLRAAVTAH